VLRTDDHSALEVRPADGLALVELAADDLVRDDYSALVDSVADDSPRGGLAPVDYSAPADFPDDSADCRADC
jgi:hypothetical protein